MKPKKETLEYKIYKKRAENYIQFLRDDKEIDFKKTLNEEQLKIFKKIKRGSFALRYVDQMSSRDMRKSYIRQKKKIEEMSSIFKRLNKFLSKMNDTTSLYSRDLDNIKKDLS